MHITSQGTVLLSAQPRDEAQFYVRSFGFQVVAELDWYVSLQHPELPTLFLDFMDAEHPAAAERQRGQVTSGLLLAFIVADAHAEAQRLRALGLTLLKELVDEPWGQRRFQVAAPGNVVVEVLERIPPDPDWLRQQSPSA